ncbi:MAG TPA: ACT domain-containing protein [Gaiellaceae bacterium]|nr:ACT domain-containing protein [Gaiellaceae bacterium]
MRLRSLDDLYAIVRLDPGEALPEWVTESPFWSVTRSDSELSIVCAQDDIPDGASAERGWCALELVGPLDFTLTGVVASLVSPLADAAVPIFVVSTFETDYLLVRETDYARAVAALEAAGHDVDA